MLATGSALGGRFGAQGGLIHFVRGAAQMLRIALLRFAPSNPFSRSLRSLGVLPPPSGHKKRPHETVFIFLVPRGGLEPPHLSIPDPKSGVSTNSTT